MRESAGGIWWLLRVVPKEYCPYPGVPKEYRAYRGAGFSGLLTADAAGDGRDAAGARGGRDRRGGAPDPVARGATAEGARAHRFRLSVRRASGPPVAPKPAKAAHAPVVPPSADRPTRRRPARRTRRVAPSAPGPRGRVLARVLPASRWSSVCARRRSAPSRSSGSPRRRRSDYAACAPGSLNPHPSVPAAHPLRACRTNTMRAATLCARCAAGFRPGPRYIPKQGLGAGGPGSVGTAGAHVGAQRCMGYGVVWHLVARGRRPVAPRAACLRGRRTWRSTKSWRGCARRHGQRRRSRRRVVGMHHSG
jgi:hypothetical protein